MAVPKLASGAVNMIYHGQLIFLAARITDRGREYINVRCMQDDSNHRFDTEQEAHDFAKSYQPKLHELN